MTEYTIREDAIAFDARIANAPDTASKLNLLEELRERYLSIATSAQMLAESNDRWSRESRERETAVEAIIKNLLTTAEWGYDEIPDGITELAELFDISLTEPRQYTITIEAQVEIMVPIGSLNPSAYDFDTHGLRINHDEWGTELNGYSIVSIEAD